MRAFGCGCVAGCYSKKGVPSAKGLRDASVRMPANRCVYVHNKGVLSAAGLRVVVNLSGQRQRALASEAKGSNGDSNAVCLYVAKRRVVDKGCVEVRCISGHRPTECAYDSR